MPWNGSGSYSLSDTLANATPGDADEVQAILDDIATAISNTVAKDGQSTLSAPLKAANGTASLPSYTFGSDTDTGFYRIGANSVGLAVNGTLLVTFDSDGMTLASGDVLGTGIFKTAGLEDDAVTYAKMQNVSATSRVIGRKSSGSGDAEECTLSEILDFIGSAAQGDVLYRGASGWERLGAGTDGQLLKSQGAAANPAWATISSLPAGTTRYGVEYNGSAWVATNKSSVAARATLASLTSTPAVVDGSHNVASCSITSTGIVRMTFTEALASDHYQPIIIPRNYGLALFWGLYSATTTYCEFYFYNAGGSAVTPGAIDVVVYGGF